MFLSCVPLIEMNEWRQSQRKANEPWVEQHYYVILWPNINLLRYSHTNLKSYGCGDDKIENVELMFIVWLNTLRQFSNCHVCCLNWESLLYSKVVEFVKSRGNNIKEWSIKIIALANLYERFFSHSLSRSLAWFFSV